MLMRILNEQIQFKNHSLNIYQASGRFKDQGTEKARFNSNNLILRIYQDKSVSFRLIYSKLRN